MDDDYPWDVGRTEAEREFLGCLRSLSNDRAHFDAWAFHPQLVVTLTIGDMEHNVVIRTLRVDFDGSSVRGGEDPSGQIDSDLIDGAPDYFALSGQRSISDLARQAFDWFALQGRRPIDRQEWIGPDHTWLRWVLVEPVERPLVAQYPNRPERPPDRVVRLSPRLI